LPAWSDQVRARKEGAESLFLTAKAAIKYRLLMEVILTGRECFIPVSEHDKFPTIQGKAALDFPFLESFFKPAVSSKIPKKCLIP